MGYVEQKGVNMRLEEYNFTANIKLGTKDGSGFIFCGRNIPFDDLDVESVERRSMQIADHNKRLTATEAKRKTPKPQYDKYVTAEFDKYSNNTKNALSFDKWYDLGEFQPYDDWLIAFLDNLRKNEASLTNRKSLLIQELINYTKMKDRIVEEIYKSITEPNTLIVIIQGTEMGDAWTTEEYERSRHGKTKTA